MCVQGAYVAVVAVVAVAALMEKAPVFARGLKGAI
jgi:hypothetical protein